MDATQAVSQVAGTLSLGGRAYVILPPTPRDKLVTYERMKALVAEQTVPPLEYVATRFAHLPGAIFTQAIREAILLGAAPPPPPDPAVVWAQYATLAGVRWRVWYHVSRVLKDFTPEQAAGLVTEDNVFDASDALDAALGLRAIDPNAQPPATGSAS